VGDLLVLCYHAVSERWPAALSVTPADFRRQLRFLVDRGYRGSTLSEALADPPSGRAVVVTFDDGYRSVLELASPILGELGLPGTVFVPTDLIGHDAPMTWPGVDGWLGGPHEAELLPLSWAEARRLVETGWEIGSHTRTHPRLTQLGDDELADELAASRHRCEREVGRPCRSLAYPYGDHDARVVAAAAAAGYEWACTVPRRIPERPEPLAWPRVGVWHDDGALAFRAKVSPAVRRFRRTAAWSALDRPRLALKRALPR